MTVPLRSYLVTRKFSRTLQILPDWINDTKNCNVKLTVLIFSTERAPDNILRTVSNLECNFPTLTKFLTLQQQTRHKNVVERLPFWDLHVVEAAVCKWTRPFQHYFLIEFRTFNLFLNRIYPTVSALLVFQCNSSCRIGIACYCSESTFVTIDRTIFR